MPSRRGKQANLLRRLRKVAIGRGASGMQIKPTVRRLQEAVTARQKTRAAGGWKRFQSV